MFPTILQIGPAAISTIGVFTALAFFFGSFLIWKKGKEEHYEEAELMDAMLLITLLGLLGARAGFVFSRWSEQIKFLDLVGNPGFSWQTALTTGIITLVFYCQKKKWEFFKVADFMVFGLTLALILFNLGRFISIFQPDNWHTLTPAAVVLLLIWLYSLLLHFDKNYRTYEWYKNKRGEAAPGFLFLFFLIFSSAVQLGDKIFYYWPQIFSWSKIGDILIIVLAGVFFYSHSGDNKDLTILNSYFKKKKGQTKNQIRFKAGMEAKE